MESTSLPGTDLAAEKKKNIWIGVVIGVVGIVGFVTFYVGLFLLMFFSPFSMFRLMPFPDMPNDAVGFQGELYIFSQGLDFQSATLEQEPREVTIMRVYSGGELGTPQEIEPFSTVAADADQIYFFYEGGYRTFNGQSWNDFENSDIGSKAQGVVDAGHIRVLSEIEGKLVLVSIDRGAVTPIALPFDKEAQPDICRLDLVSLNRRLHLFEKDVKGLTHYRQTPDGWSEPENREC